MSVSFCDYFLSLQMTQNMFQEGLYQVFFKSSAPAPTPLTQVNSRGELVNVRIHRWFGTVVSGRLLVAGVRRRLPRLGAKNALLSSPAELPLKLCVSPSPAGGADPRRRGLPARHGQSRLRELRLRPRHVHTRVVQPLRKSKIRPWLAGSNPV